MAPSLRTKRTILVFARQELKPLPSICGGLEINQRGAL
jgi:hypothetical protein